MIADKTQNRKNYGGKREKIYKYRQGLERFKQGTKLKKIDIHR